MSRPAGWRFFVDRGGTFTDVVAIAPDGTLRVAKVPSRDEGGDAVASALRTLAGDDLAAVTASVRMGTTVATNALLERRVARVALATTRGFGDALLIGTQERPALFSLRIEKTAPLTHRVIEVDERVLADGAVRRAPDADVVRRELAAAREDGCDALVVTFVHGWVFPAHERLVGAIGREVGFPLVVLSSECDPEPGFLARLETSVVDAAVTPPLRAAIEQLRASLGPRAELRLMQSGGGLARAEHFRGRDAVLSGPAAGAMALASLASEAGCDQAIGLDMGGTSTDVSRWSADEDLDRARERRVAGFRVRAPMADIVTVAAGGGSILGRIGGRLVAGPESAGAQPGPAAYGLGGPATVTDANVVLGRVQAAWFPACFGASGRETLSLERARERLGALGHELGLSADEAALGAFRVANESMARALRQVSVARGRDPERHVLVAFGGAAPQHACALAELLGMRRVIVPAMAGVLSAVGMGLAPVRTFGARGLLLPLEGGLDLARGVLRELGREQDERLAAEGIARERRQVELALELRHRGTDGGIAVPAPEDASAADLREEFERRHERLFGFRREGLPVEIVAARASGAGSLEPLPAPERPRADRLLVPVDRAALRLPGEFGGVDPWDVPVFRWRDLLAGDEIPGPALVVGETTTLVVDPGWLARVTAAGHVDMERQDDAEAPPRAAAEERAVRVEVFGSRFMSIAEQMGETLRLTAQSPNIRERLDFSCALFTRDGQLVANAPHVPVHLGAMGATVRALLEARGEAGMREGLALVSNDPYAGGSHLPDITVVTPVLVEGRPAFFVASRGHHADVGGVVPGSMPPFARDIAEEGIRLHDVALLEGGEVREDELRRLLSAGPHPARGVDERLADLRAQAAANAAGARLLLELASAEGARAIEAAMREVIADAAAATRELLASLPQGTRRLADVMDEGSRVEVAVTVRDGRATFDFTGTSPQEGTSLNAPRAVVRACVLYVVRCLLGRDVPLNDGVLEPIDIVVPDGTLLSPRPPAAVCAGNVETSMRVADVLLAALGAQAASQGTMNNITFGTSDSAFYETVGGGAGAGPGFAGADAVHSHLTNTRITDVEVLERRAPIVVREFSVRRGSGGAGRHRGGDGIVREIEFRAAMTLAVVSERRASDPFGMAGGGPGARGRNVLVRCGRRGAQGAVEDLGGKAQVDVREGDVLRVETPGGGGWGEPPVGERSRAE